MREAAVTLSQGGGFQAYYTQNRDGSLTIDKLKSMADVAVFARARQKYCHHSVAVPQVAVLLSSFDYQHRNIPGSPGALFPNYTGGAAGILECLLECQYSVDLLGEASLQPDMSRFPVIVVPECETLSALLCDDLVDYARNGGALLVIGESMSSLFSGLSGVSLQGDKWFSAALGKGRIGFIPEDVAKDYESAKREEGIRAGMKTIVGGLFPDPVAEVVSSPYVDVSVRKLDGKLQVHLVNTSGDHRNMALIESIDPVRNLEVSVRCPERPSGIIRRPDGRSIPFRYKDGKATFKLDSLEIYDIIEVID